MVILDKDFITVRNHLRVASMWLRHPEEHVPESEVQRKLVAAQIEDLARSMVPFPLEFPMEEVNND
jgi:hypothetical protein